MDRRKLAQTASAVVYNPNLKGFFTGEIYGGRLKTVCVPGLNCYSCPGAAGSCPVGSLQAVMGSPHRISLYVAGFLVAVGTLFGRFICGWACPFGLFQELLHKIPGRKIRAKKVFGILKYLKYAVLAALVIALPAALYIVNGVGEPTFCKYVCPAGTLEAGIPLVLADSGLRAGLGWLYGWKALLLAAAIILSVLIYRPFCRFVCPLGAIYALFNRISVFGLALDRDRCTGCGACERACRLDIRAFETPDSAECIRCLDCVKACPEGALSIRRPFTSGAPGKTAGTGAG